MHVLQAMGRVVSVLVESVAQVPSKLDTHLCDNAQCVHVGRPLTVAQLSLARMCDVPFIEAALPSM